MAGGLSLGSGMIVGGVLGALTGLGLMEGYHAMTDTNQKLKWEKSFLRSCLQECLLFYITSSSFGRGQGHFDLSLINQSSESSIPSQADHTSQLNQEELRLMQNQRQTRVHCVDSEINQNWETIWTSLLAIDQRSSGPLFDGDQENQQDADYENLSPLHHQIQSMIHRLFKTLDPPA